MSFGPEGAFLDDDAQNIKQASQIEQPHQDDQSINNETTNAIVTTYLLTVNQINMHNQTTGS